MMHHVLWLSFLASPTAVEEGGSPCPSLYPSIKKRRGLLARHGMPPGDSTSTWGRLGKPPLPATKEDPFFLLKQNAHGGQQQQNSARAHRGSSFLCFSFTPSTPPSPLPPTFPFNPPFTHPNTNVKRMSASTTIWRINQS